MNRSTPVLKLRNGDEEAEHVHLTGLLNSSTACFWLKQICYPKGGDQVGDEGARVRKVLWDIYYEIDAAKLKRFPIPNILPDALGDAIQAEADRRSALTPDRLCEAGVPASLLVEARDQAARYLGRMIALQEELDWQTYHLCGLLAEDLSLPPDKLPALQLGERPFEILMARQIADGELETTWFERHHSKPMTELPEHWPEHYRSAVKRRIEVIQSNRDIALIEAPEYKRRWTLPPWEELQQRALENWLLDRMEAYIEQLARAMAGRLGGKVGLAPRLFLKKLVADVLDRIELFPDF